MTISAFLRGKRGTEGIRRTFQGYQLGTEISGAANINVSAWAATKCRERLVSLSSSFGDSASFQLVRPEEIGQRRIES